MTLDKCFRKELWRVIEESKKGTNFNSQKQFDNLHTILKKNYSIDDIEMLLQEFNCVVNEYIGSKEFKELFKVNGGFIQESKDAVYLDFASWLVGQGIEIYDRFFKKGNEVVVDYIRDNKINSENYEYECLMYAFFNMNA